MLRKALREGLREGSREGSREALALAIRTLLLKHLDISYFLYRL